MSARKSPLVVPRSSRRSEETGSLSVEMAIMVPALILIFGLIFIYGRVAQVNGSLESGTRDAARSATKSRSLEEAQAAALAAVKLGTEKTPQDCKDSLDVRVDQFIAGQPLRVTSTCTYDISDAGLPGAPGTITSKASFVSVVDDFRTVNPG